MPKEWHHSLRGREEGLKLFLSDLSADVMLLGQKTGEILAQPLIERFCSSTVFRFQCCSDFADCFFSVDLAVDKTAVIIQFYFPKFRDNGAKPAEKFLDRMRLFLQYRYDTVLRNFTGKLRRAGEYEIEHILRLVFIFLHISVCCSAAE